jgi:predicted metal-dependent hydrolase
VQLAFPFEADTAAPVTTYVRHRRARRYILRVLDDGSLRVTLPRWGSKRDAQAFVASSHRWIARQRAIPPAAPVRRHPDEAELRRQAAGELPAQLLALAARHDITVTRIAVRNQRSRWGSCAPSGAITLNWRLLLVPDFVREYVLLHELMHRRQLNHSRRFWKLVESVCPRQAEARRWLKQHEQTVFRGSVYD